MVNYEYTCRECGYKWTESLSMKDRDLPLSKPCPYCGLVGSVRRVFSTGVISYDTKDPLTRAGDGWKEVQQKIISGCTKDHTIRTK